MLHAKKTRAAVAVLAAAALAAPSAGASPIIDNVAQQPPASAVPTTIQVVRPQRTIVRDADQALPIALSSAALLVALGGSGFVLVGGIRRRRLESSH
jgi:hypothetical protein